MPPLVAQIPPPPFQGFSLGPLDVRMYGVLIAIGAFLALRMAVARYERFGGDGEVAERTALWILGIGFLGARIGYVIPRFDRFVDDPLSIFAIWEGGLAIFGGLFLGTIAGIVMIRRQHGDMPAFMDAVAPAVPLAQAIGRWGNYFNEELYGTPTDLPWAVKISGGDTRFGEATTFHPTFLYESIGNAILVVVLLRIDRAGRLRRGSLLWIYAIGYGVIRAVTESLRVDTDFRILGLSRNNWIALLVVVAGLVGLRWWQRRPGADTELRTDLEDEGHAGDDPEHDRIAEVEHDTSEDPDRLDPLDHEQATGDPDDAPRER